MTKKKSLIVLFLVYGFLANLIQIEALGKKNTEIEIKESVSREHSSIVTAATNSVHGICELLSHSLTRIEDVTLFDNDPHVPLQKERRWA